MPAQPDFEQYAHTLQLTMAAAIEEAESLAALAAADRAAAADVHITIREKLNDLETLARQAAEKYVAEHRQQLQERYSGGGAHFGCSETAEQRGERG